MLPALFVEHALACSIDPSVVAADSLYLEFLDFIGSRMFRGAGFQAGYARFHAGILPTALLLAAQVKKNFLNTTVVCSRLNL